MPIPLLTSLVPVGLVIVLASCCATAEPAPTAMPPVPTKLHLDREVLAIIPGHDFVELVISGGQRAGISPGDRGYMRCIDVEVRIFEVFDFRSRARMELKEPWPKLGPVRVYLQGADPKPWCPAPVPQ